LLRGCARPSTPNGSPKKFYERFQKEHATFLAFIHGIALRSDCEWYASLMLNRLMFVYFIQKKGMLATSGRGQLDGDVDYLSHKLAETRQRSGEDQFYSFYRYFLLRLFLCWLLSISILKKSGNDSSTGIGVKLSLEKLSLMPP
jgi:hypothetical protein